MKQSIGVMLVKLSLRQRLIDKSNLPPVATAAALQNTFPLMSARYSLVSAVYYSFMGTAPY